METMAFVILVLIVVWLTFRFWPVDKNRWHLDPADTSQKRAYSVRLIGQDAPRFSVDATALLSEVRTMMGAEPRTRLIDGSEDEGMMTFVVFTRFGYRDFVTFKAVDEVGGSKLSIYSRPGLNVYDWKVNATRVDRWIGKLTQAVHP